MKNLILLLLAMCFAFFFIAFIDAINMNAYDFSELSLMGKTFTVLFTVTFLSILYFMFIHYPLMRLINKLKK